ncbi:MAG: hypothetical protein INQ03_17340 [Candidatus Heimdallarchaeota archaeon]|nr:hypothetical protein [Candidatus Heimdallarchaeota archaeon]
MNLGNAFARRKQLDSEINTWINRLSLAGRETRQYRTTNIEGKELKAIPGTEKVYSRNYSIEECRKKIDELIAEDKDLALRISLTNQIAKATVTDLDGNEVELSIPELLVLKNDIVPKMEKALRSIPKKATGIEIIANTDTYTKWRTITPYYKNEQTLGEKGVAENRVIDYYDVIEVNDYGLYEREIFDSTDKVHAWMQRLKEAVNKANETELIEL